MRQRHHHQRQGYHHDPRVAAAAAAPTTTSGSSSSTTTTTTTRSRAAAAAAPAPVVVATPPVPRAHSYVPITQDIVPQQETRDKLRRQAQHRRGITPTDTPTTPVRLPDNPHPASRTIQPIPHSAYSHPTLSLNTNPAVRPPSYVVHTTTPIPLAHFITPYRSTTTPSSIYLSDPLNAYAHLGMPKPFVHLCGPPLDLTLDLHITGDGSRFVHSGCRPNAVLRPIICKGQDPSLYLLCVTSRLMKKSCLVGSGTLVTQCIVFPHSSRLHICSCKYCSLSPLLS
jgi:hypothetical protein